MIVQVATDHGEIVGVVEVDSHHGPWSDEWQHGGAQDAFQEYMNKAAQLEGGE